MPRRFLPLFRQHLEPLTRAWADAVYADRRTDLATILSFRELVEHVPDITEELARLLEERAGQDELTDAARRVRGLALARFQQGALIDEVARELMLLRDTLCEFLWQHAPTDAGADARELREALRRTTNFFDELIAQAILVYAASLRPVVPTRGSVWPPPRGRRGGRP
jgi:RsbT co-antagonist protein rsbRD N-terminal domain